MENITANVQSLTGNLALDTIVSGLITLVVCYIAIRIVKTLVAKALGKATKLELPVKNRITKAVTFVLWAVAIIIVAGAFGINAASLVALLSVVGLALSMSVQGLLSNFFSGILLLINKPFKEGDFVEAGDKVGVIKSIGFFNTTINTLDNVSMVVPNGDLTGATVEGRTRLQCEIIKAIREVCGKDFLISVRLGAADHMPGGSEAGDVPEAAERFQKAGADMISITTAVNTRIFPAILLFII